MTSSVASLTTMPEAKVTRLPPVPALIPPLVVSPIWALTLYTVPNLAVYDTDAYRAIGGGGNASKAFHNSISRRRNVYDGVSRMPDVPETHRVLLCEDAAQEIDLPGILFVPLTARAGNQQAGATKIDGQPERRAIALVDEVLVHQQNLTAIEGLSVYRPITTYYA